MTAPLERIARLRATRRRSVTTELRHEDGHILLTITPDATNAMAALRRLATFLADNAPRYVRLLREAQAVQAQRRCSAMHSAYRHRQLARRRRK